MPSAGEIDFGGTIEIEEAQDTLGFHKAWFRHIVFTEPAKDGSTTERDGHGSQKFARERFLRRWNEGLHPGIFVLEDDRGAQDGIVDRMAKKFPQIRQSFLPEPVASVLGVLIARVFPERNTARGNIIGNRFASYAEHGSMKDKLNFSDSQRSLSAHSSQTRAARSTQKVKKDRFDLIISMMCQKDVVTLLRAYATRQKFMPDVAGGGLNGHAAFLGFLLGPGCLAEITVAEFSSCFLDQPRVGAGCLAAQSVIQMTDHQMAKSQFAKSMEECHGVPAPGDADQVFAAGRANGHRRREIPEEIRRCFFRRSTHAMARAGARNRRVAGRFPAMPHRGGLTQYPSR